MHDIIELSLKLLVYLTGGFYLAALLKFLLLAGELLYHNFFIYLLHCKKFKAKVVAIHCKNKTYYPEVQYYNGEIVEAVSYQGIHKLSKRFFVGKNLIIRVNNERLKQYHVINKYLVIVLFFIVLGILSIFKWFVEMFFVSLFDSVVMIALLIVFYFYLSIPFFRHAAKLTFNERFKRSSFFCKQSLKGFSFKTSQWNKDFMGGGHGNPYKDLTYFEKIKSFPVMCEERVKERRKDETH